MSVKPHIQEGSSSVGGDIILNVIDIYFPRFVELIRRYRFTVSLFPSSFEICDIIPVGTLAG
jgi:hypothetical protein